MCTSTVPSIYYIRVYQHCTKYLTHKKTSAAGGGLDSAAGEVGGDGKAHRLHRYLSIPSLLSILLILSLRFILSSLKLAILSSLAILSILTSRPPFFMMTLERLIDR